MQTVYSFFFLFILSSIFLLLLKKMALYLNFRRLRAAKVSGFSLIHVFIENRGFSIFFLSIEKILIVKLRNPRHEGAS